MVVGALTLIAQSGEGQGDETQSDGDENRPKLDQLAVVEKRNHHSHQHTDAHRNELGFPVAWTHALELADTTADNGVDKQSTYHRAQRNSKQKTQINAVFVDS